MIPYDMQAPVAVRCLWTNCYTLPLPFFTPLPPMPVCPWVCPVCDQMRQTAATGLSVPFSICLILADLHILYATKQKSLPPDTFSGLKIAEKYVCRRDPCSPSRGRRMQRRYENNCDFRPISRFVSERIQVKATGVFCVVPIYGLAAFPIR